MEIYSLVRAADLLHERRPRVAPAGSMAAFAGPQYTAREVAAAYRQYMDDTSSLDMRIARKIRAFPVPALVGVMFACRPDDALERLGVAVGAALPGTTWATGEHSRGGPALIERYSLLHCWIPAPADAATGQAMTLTLVGDARPRGAGADSVRGDAWGEDIEVTITAATWANAGDIGFGTPFYM